MPSKKTNPKVRLSAGARKPAKTGGLGRGLDALISREQTRHVAAPVAKAAVARAVSDVPVKLVVPSPWQPRQDFDPDALRELADSIKVHGVIQPLLCRKGANGSYELIGGERRLRAAQLAGLEKVPVILMDAADRDAAELALVENLSYVQCPNCGEKIYPFGESRMAEMADKYKIRLAASLPIDPKLAEGCDRGRIEDFEGEWLDGIVEVIRNL